MTTFPTTTRSTDRNSAAVPRPAFGRRLGPRQTFSRRLAEGEILRLQVFSGHLWVTLENHSEDHLLAAGDLQPFTGPGLLVAEGIEKGAEFGVVSP